MSPKQKSIIGSSDAEFAAEVLMQVIQTLWMPSSLSEEQRQKRVEGTRPVRAALRCVEEGGGMLARNWS